MNLSRLKIIVVSLIMCSISGGVKSQNLITNVHNRNVTSLNGKWQYIVDPYETGFYDYRYNERRQTDREAYWNSDIPNNKTDRLEHGYINKYELQVPGDWNSQDPQFTYYEGTIWYRKTFDYVKTDPDNRVFLYFGAVNYRADVYLNGKKLGMHKGGFTPFQFEVEQALLKEKDNFLVVKVDNKRMKEEIPTVNTDWWNYGGITRDVLLIETPPVFIQDFTLNLKKGEPGSVPKTRKAEVVGWVKLNGNHSGTTVTIDIPELKVKKEVKINGAEGNFSITLPRVELWSDVSPKLYEVVVHSPSDKVTEKIGFRTIDVLGKKLLLNGKAIFLRGICMHEEIAEDIRRAYSKDDAKKLLGQAKELNSNMVRLAHYPHNENMARTADSLGLLVWSEIPVYWTIDFSSEEVLEKAKMQLEEMITRDRNRASVIIWSVGNETPVSPDRTEFMKKLISQTRTLDPTRLVSAALEVHYNEGKHTIDDPLGAFTDIVSVNEYLGWYGGLPSSCQSAVWETKYDKPLFFSETGAGALAGYHADSLTRWSEEYQEWFYREQINMMKNMPDNFIGLAPWILVDFRSPRRNHPEYQEGWNRKGLIGQNGNKKKAFDVLKSYYDEMEKYQREKN